MAYLRRNGAKETIAAAQHRRLELLLVAVETRRGQRDGDGCPAAFGRRKGRANRADPHGVFLAVEGDAVPGADGIKLCLQRMQVGDRGWRQGPQRRGEQAPRRRGVVGRKHRLAIGGAMQREREPDRRYRRSRRTATTWSTKVMLEP